MAEPDLVVRVADERDEAALAAAAPRLAGGTRRAPRRRPGVRGRVRAVVAPRAAAADVLAGRGGLGAQRLDAAWARSTSSRSCTCPARAPAPGGSGRSAARSCSAPSPTAACPGALLARAVEHARERRYRRLCSPRRGSSASFYRRAGFQPAGESLLVLDPLALPESDGDGHYARRLGAMARVRPGEAANPAPPTVQRIRVRFAKRGRLRFLSHRDVARSFERAVRRAGHAGRALARLQPAPAAVLDRGRAHRGGQRGRVRGDRAHPPARSRRPRARAGRRAARRPRRARRRGGRGHAAGRPDRRERVAHRAARRHARTTCGGASPRWRRRTPSSSSG